MHTLFKTEKAEAQAYVRTAVADSEAKVLRIHDADIAGLRGNFDILVKQNETLIQQNTENLKSLPTSRPIPTFALKRDTRKSCRISSSR